MSIATIVTRGYGSFGSVNLLPTWGYAIGVVVPGPFCWTHVIVCPTMTSQPVSPDMTSALIAPAATSQLIATDATVQLVAPTIVADTIGCC